MWLPPFPLDIDSGDAIPGPRVSTSIHGRVKRLLASDADEDLINWAGSGAPNASTPSPSLAALVALTFHGLYKGVGHGGCGIAICATIDARDKSSAMRSQFLHIDRHPTHVPRAVVANVIGRNCEGRDLDPTANAISSGNLANNDELAHPLPQHWPSGLLNAQAATSPPARPAATPDFRAFCSNFETLSDGFAPTDTQ